MQATRATTTTTTIADSDPYPWPWDGVVRADRFALLICGTQQVHADASIGVGRVAGVIHTVAGAFRRAGSTVCHIRHTAPVGRPGPHRVRPLLPSVGERGWAPTLRAEPGDVIVVASGHDGFCGSGLDLELRSRGAELVVAVGMASEVAVSCTVRSANDRGYECLTLTDAVAPVDLETSRGDLRSITMSGGIFGALSDSESLLSLLAVGVAQPTPHTHHPGTHEPAIHEPAENPT